MQLKTCNRCKISKTLEMFCKDKTKPDGLNVTCRQCSSEKHRKHYLENREKVCKRTSEYAQKNRDKTLEYQKQHYLENRDRHLTLQKKRREENPEVFRKRSRESYINNKPLYVEKTARRRATRLDATPDWLTKEHLQEIKEMYEIISMFKLYTGQEYHVDHIIPLQHDLVCGLHVPWNLQILSAKDNLSKSNKFTVE